MQSIYTLNVFSYIICLTLIRFLCYGHLIIYIFYTSHLKSSDSQDSVSDRSKKCKWFPILNRVMTVCAPNNFLMENVIQMPTCDDNSSLTVRVIQLCLVDELSCKSNLIDKSDDIYHHTISPYGLGARSGGYLLVSRYIGISGQSLRTFEVETRVMHGFTHSVSS